MNLGQGEVNLLVILPGTLLETPVRAPCAVRPCEAASCLALDLKRGVCECVRVCSMEKGLSSVYSCPDCHSSLSFAQSQLSLPEEEMKVERDIEIQR